MVRYLGLDIHKISVQVCMLDEQGTVLHQERFPCTRSDLLHFAQTKLRSTDRLVLEATTHAWAVARLLAPYVAEVVVSNPLQTKAIACAKVKTDKIDARVLADLLRCNYLPQVWIPDLATQDLRTLTHRRAALVAERTRLKNRIHAVLAQSLHTAPDADLFSKGGQKWLAQVELSALDRELIDGDLRLLASTQAEIDLLEKRLAKEAYSDDRVRLLMTLPGVDFTVAQTVIAALGDISRFPDADHAAGYLGLVPSTDRSAERCYHGPITKRGSSHARWMLIQAAQHAGSHHGPLGVFYHRLEKKKGHNVAVVAAARKLVVYAYHMLKNNQPYRYAQPKATRDKLARLRVLATGKKRTGGTPKGAPRSARYGTGQGVRTTPSLAQALATEGLPAPTPLADLPKGELKALEQTHTLAFVRSIQVPQSKVRTYSPKQEVKA